MAAPGFIPLPDAGLPFRKRVRIAWRTLVHGESPPKSPIRERLILEADTSQAVKATEELSEKVQTLGDRMAVLTERSNALAAVWEKVDLGRPKPVQEPVVTKSEYAVIATAFGFAHLEEKVQIAIGEGWRPIGGIAAYPACEDGSWATTGFAQTMVKTVKVDRGQA